MLGSWIERAKQFKSPLSVVAGILYRSRETLKARVRQKSEEIRELKRLLEEERKATGELRDRLADKDADLVRLREEDRQLREQPPILPYDPVLPGHQFGPRMISLCVNLSRRVGFRATPVVLQIVFVWLNVSRRIPGDSAVRLWFMQVGDAALEKPVEQVDDMIWNHRRTDARETGMDQ